MSVATSSERRSSCWDVDDIERTVAALRERGVELERYDEVPGKRSMDGLVIEDGGAKAAWFKDPDGNILAIIQYVG